MDHHQLTLVLPRNLHTTDKPAQQGALMNLQSFIDLARERQM
jgi:hypothetical protein